MEYQRTHDFVYGADGEILNEAPKDFYLPQDQYKDIEGRPLQQFGPQPLNNYAPDYHQRVQQYDPELQPASFLYMMIQGQIEDGEVFGNDLIKIDLTFTAGSEWELIHGENFYSSQYAKQFSNSGKHIWNLSFDMGYRTLSPSGWPQMVLQIKSPEGQEDVVRGYACIHIPTSPGRHKVKARFYCPIRNTWWNVFKSKIFGPKSDFPNDPFLVAGAEVREVSSVMYMGYAYIVFNIFQRNFGRFGYKTG